MQCDLVVVGGGNSGMTAAITAACAGLKVILLEKEAYLGAGDSILMSTGLAAGGSGLIKKLGIKRASAEDFYLDLLKQAADKKIQVDKESVRAYAMRSGEIIDWLTTLGVNFGRFHHESYMHMMDDGSAPGRSVVPALIKELEKCSVDYRLKTKALNIITDGGKAAGIETDKGRIRSKAVLIATGGFAANKHLLEKYNPGLGKLPSTGADCLTGDGIIMAEKAGVDIHNMDQLKINYLCHVPPGGRPISLTALRDRIILLNFDGERFMDEKHPSINYKSVQMLKQLYHCAWAVFDQSAVDELKLIAGYNEAGYFISGKTAKELAEKTGADKAKFEKAVNAWAKKNVTLYAALVTPAMQSTYGGIHVNAEAQAVDKYSKIIQGLYAAGATSGHGSFANEVGTQGIITLTYGRIAAETIVRDIV